MYCYFCFLVNVSRVQKLSNSTIFLSVLYSFIVSYCQTSFELLSMCFPVASLCSKSIKLGNWLDASDVYFQSLRRHNSLLFTLVSNSDLVKVAELVALFKEFCISWDERINIESPGIRFIN